MPTYTYRCVSESCEPFTLIRPMSASATPAECPRCGTGGRRVFEAPALRNLSSGLHRAMDTAAASAETPQVVRSIPASAGPASQAPRRMSPKHPALPRM